MTPGTASREDPPQHRELEVELKLAATDGRPLRLLRRRRRLGPAILGTPDSFDELDRYLDTEDHALASARWACRLRERRGTAILSLKGPRRATGGSPLTAAGLLHARPEVEGTAGDVGPAGTRLAVAALPPSPARDLLASLAGDRPLVERLALRQRRTEREVRVADRRVGVLSLDRVDVLANGQKAWRLWAVELELAGDPGSDASPAPGLVAALSDGLSSVPGLRPDRQSKLEHALELLGATVPPRART